VSKLLDIDVNEQLKEVLEQYNMNIEKVDDYLFVDGFFPGLSAIAFEMEDFGESVVVQLDITVLLPEESFVESFVAQAESHEEAIAIAFQEFEVNVLHTFIMAFWEKAKKVENGVGTDVWEINGHRWQAVVSNFGYKGTEEFEAVIEDVDTMYDVIVSEIKNMKLDETICAFRTVYTNTTEGQRVSEAYKNNEPLPKMEEAVSNLPWKRVNSFYTVRNLILLMKLTEDAPKVS